MQTERVTFLTTPAAKAALCSRAAAQGLSVGEYIRRKVEDDDDLTPAQEAELRMLIDAVNEAVPKMNASIDEMIEALRHTREDMDKLLDREALA
ncbi:Spy/CpxP family protein refolding chaperone [Novosphingobium chloroacetimidivorans]|uniref:Spy/CpxP family protein refolding chaperone n=1 Tax=Novosphingobium chloroacetimidivorans TaxID=1428314 RepID=A0A7W7KCY0_9SPHN|nr:hypothetical protein [Novosphingobium chloroacetimidivorans]MBB4859788.1 Spy/CpxP family protein refolding chaperone [Novosphingobium chloroacetimidivorans]